MRDRYASLREGLVGAWIPSVSGSGLLLPDLSGQGNNGTLTNMGPEDWVSSQYGRALDFDWVNDYVEVSPLKSLTTGCIAAWFKTSRSAHAANNDEAIFCLSNTATNNIVRLQVGEAAGIYPDESLNFIVLNNGTSLLRMHIRKGHTFYKDGKWHHVVVKVDGIANTIFVDGINEAASITFQDGTSTTQAFTNITSPNFCCFGVASWNNFGIRDQFGGQLDDARIYNRALSEPEIKLLASRPGIGLRPQRRTMYYAPPTGARRRRILTSMP